MTPVAVYIHIPFCPSKCGYCDFNSFAMQGDIMARTTRAIIAEIEQGPMRGRPAKTIFFGGGTPSYIPVDQLCAILQAVVTAHPPIEECEITSEANPGTADSDNYRAMREAGFNRISLGAQSFLDDDLLTLGRVHGSRHISEAVEKARVALFDNLNLDLMFALPGQSRRGWKANLALALELKPEHLSLYCLTIEPNTAFHRSFQRGEMTQPGEDAQVGMYEMAQATMAEAGYEFYEISNFAKPGQECRHNLCYWRGEEYAAYGPGAVSLRADGDGRIRETRIKHPERYCEAAETGSSLVYDSERLDADTIEFERIMMGLRLSEGIELSSSSLPQMLDRGWIEFDAPRYRLTPAGRHFHNEVVMALT